MSIPSSRRRRRDEAREAARLQVLLDQRRAARGRASRGGRGRPLRSASSLMRSASRSARRRLFTNTIVERCAADELEQRRVHRRPDRAGGRLVRPGPSRRRPARPAANGRGDAPSSRMSSTGTTTSRSSSFRLPASTSAISPAGPDEAPADLVQRPLGGRQADPLERLLGDAARAARARARGARRASCPRPRAPRRGSRVSTDAQHLAALRGEEQVERLGRRDQDVGRLCGASAGGRAAACRPSARPTRERRAEPGERAAEVPLDVVVERLERRDVEEPEPLARRRRSGDRVPGGTPRASCPSRSAPGRARARPPRSPARPAPARASALPNARSNHALVPGESDVSASTTRA